MCVVIDTNVITKILTGNQPLAEKVWRLHGGRAIVIPEPIYAEVKTFCVLAPDPAQAWSAFNIFKEELDAKIAPCSLTVWEKAGERFAGYIQERSLTKLQYAKCGVVSEFSCPKCSEPITSRQHILVDFLVGAFALGEVEKAILTLDTGVFKTYFPELNFL